MLTFLRVNEVSVEALHNLGANVTSHATNLIVVMTGVALRGDMGFGEKPKFSMEFLAECCSSVRNAIALINESRPQKHSIVVQAGVEFESKGKTISEIVNYQQINSVFYRYDRKFMLTTAGVKTHAKRTEQMFDEKLDFPLGALRKGLVDDKAKEVGVNIVLKLVSFSSFILNVKNMRGKKLFVCFRTNKLAHWDLWTYCSLVSTSKPMLTMRTWPINNSMHPESHKQYEKSGTGTGRIISRKLFIVKIDQPNLL